MSMIAAQTLRRTAATATSKNVIPSMSSFGAVDRRWKSTDAGDVIGIDLGTTNSCVAIMVRAVGTLSYV
jgi:molecular chaperone DnaK